MSTHRHLNHGNENYVIDIDQAHEGAEPWVTVAEVDPDGVETFLECHLHDLPPLVEAIVDALYMWATPPGGTD